MFVDEDRSLSRQMEQNKFTRPENDACTVFECENECKHGEVYETTGMNIFGLQDKICVAQFLWNA